MIVPTATLVDTWFGLCEIAEYQIQRSSIWKSALAYCQSRLQETLQVSLPADFES
jgi:hypothetical protein